MLEKKYRIRSSIALSYRDGIMEFFKTNIRENIVLKTSCNLIDFIKKFDGIKPLKDILQDSIFDDISAQKLISFLHNKNILIEVNCNYDKNVILEKYRLINFLEEYCFDTKQVVNILAILSQKPVLVIGLGAVGTWIVDILRRCGVEKFILVDHDKVDLSNIHRQDFYFESDIGRLKLDCIEERLLEIGNTEIEKFYTIFDENFFHHFDKEFCLAINCADYPNVDTTTNILGKECMKRNIPHIIGGGYNLHLSLIGQSVIPYESACHECFNKALQKINTYHAELKKLHRANRKIGSFTPLCTISASLAALDAFKILCGFYNKLTNTSTRIEFKIREMDIERMPISRDPTCQCCKEKNDIKRD